MFSIEAMMDVTNSYLDLFFGYTALWGIVVIYLFRLVREQRTCAKSLEERKLLEERETSRRNIEKQRLAS